MEEMAEQLRGLFSQSGAAKRSKRKMKIGEAARSGFDEEAGKLINEEEIRSRAIHSAEQNGIVFIDEIDKVIPRRRSVGRGVAARRAARPVATGGGHHREHQIRDDPDGSHSFVASRRFSSEQAQRPDSRCRVAFRSGLNFSRFPCRILRPSYADPCVAGPPIPSLAGDRSHAGIHPGRHYPPGMERIRSQQAHREHWCPSPVHRHGAPT